MGYYTQFRGHVVETNSESYAQLIKDAENGVKVTPYAIHLEEFVDGDWLNGGESMKWYDYDSDMREVSLRYPGLVFGIEGEGEEAGDLWRAYYRDGSGVTVKAEFQFREVDFDKEIPANPAAAAARKQEIAAEVEAEKAKAEQEARMHLDQAEVALKEAQERLDRLTS